ncbi:response regulator [Marinilongibacter aquaticus]|uniref:response regulator n=1 Tax=Marinilongibacter aquaticus TaxID=2975157 RepID=UPI0021BD70EC|nr:response regulator [Marinilongibacter aquaticus]UBM60720.1 response regulator [Marinilongibacter aquaticus]
MEKDQNKEKLAKLHILIATDNLLNQKLLQSIFDHYGTKIKVVNSGSEALAGLETVEPVDMILMEEEMPEMSGSAVAKEIKVSLGMNMPIVLLTNHNTYVNVEGSHVDGFLSRPLKVEKLIELVLKLTSLSRNGAESDGVYEQLDEDYFEMVSGASSDLQKELVDLFEMQLSEFEPSLRSLCQMGGRDGLKADIHRFRSTLLSVGLLKVEKRLKLVELSLAEGNEPMRPHEVCKGVIKDLQVGLKELKRKVC